MCRFKKLALWIAALAAINCPFLMEAGESESIKGAVLKTDIRTFPAQTGSNNQEYAQDYREGRVQPGTKMRLQAIVENIGDVLSSPGQIEIVFAYPPTITQEPGVIFATELVGLPAIPPGESRTINFAALHLWPSLFDFVRQNWGTREYQAIVSIQGYQEISGTRSISFSAYYYEGPSEEKAVRVSSADHVPAW